MVKSWSVAPNHIRLHYNIPYYNMIYYIIHVYTYIYIYIYRERERDVYREREREILY